ncbi:hypothetical protein [Sphingomonas bacterium]|uniref:hypothetical protein n=1 Tax=Sphingomonas bacterium TaxID=1895847 RepID=UPI00157523E6|nr:hypothetical protein [Sphingomonas bacterium]
MKTLGSRKVEHFLAQFHDIAPDHLAAYAGRLKQITRRGFPVGVGAGRGTPAEYDADQLFQLVAAMELTQFGVMPLRAIRLVSEAWPRLRDAVLEVWLVVDAASRGFVIDRPAIFWRVEVEALRHMARPDRPYSPDTEDTLDAMSADGAHAALDRRGYGNRRHAFIAADQVIHDALTKLGIELGGHNALAGFMQRVVPAPSIQV